MSYTHAHDKRLFRLNREQRQRWLGYFLLPALLTLFLTGCEKPTLYEKIQRYKTLHVITRNAPSVYYEGREGPAGFEYELAKLFAEELGVELDLKVASTRSQILSALDNEYTHLAAAGMVASEIRSERFQYSKPYMDTTSIVIYRLGSRTPNHMGDLVGKRVGVVGDSYHNEELETLRKQFPELKWQALDSETNELMRMIQEQELDYAVITSHELELHQAYYPRVKQAFEIGEPQQFSWFLPRETDQRLLDRVNAFFKRIEEDGTLLQLKERYFGHLGQLNYVGARTFIQQINARLPKYDKIFREAANKTDLDWRLLAAMGYQESHWDPKATSPTGVRGIMMLTTPTAREMGVKNRLDPIQSIHGGARYLATIRARISDQIPEPDRTWFALASYNVGYYHLEDARMLTEKHGKDPNKWVDVKEFLPLLQQKQYYKQTRYGYARGNEPVIFVQNIRRYYDVLTWMTTPQPGENTVAQSIIDSNLIQYTD